jgi:hypothetical protein
VKSRKSTLGSKAPTPEQRARALAEQQKLQELKAIKTQEFGTMAEYVAAIKVLLDNAGDRVYSATEIIYRFPRLDGKQLVKLAEGDLCAYATRGEPVLGTSGFSKGKVTRPWQWHAPKADRKPLESVALAGNTGGTGAQLAEIITRLSAIEAALADIKSLVGWTAA